jgi:nucleoside-diphosphate-sugar epimerase
MARPPEGTVPMPYDLASFERLIGETDFDQIHFLSGNSSPAQSQMNPLLDLSATNIPWLSLLEAARRQAFRGSIWFASSVAVYGSSAEPVLREDAPCKPLSLYGLSKQLGENHCRLYHSVHGLHTGIYRLFSAYGPGLRRQLVFDVVERLRKQPAKLELLGTGCEGRDLSYVWDHANAIRVLSSAITPRGEIFNIGSGKAYTVREVVDRICAICGATPEVVFNGKRRDFDAEWWCADVTKLQALGIAPAYTLDRGLRETVPTLIEENYGGSQAH